MKALILAVLVLASPGLSLVPGLDHVIVAVDDLDAAAESYRKLGFTLKPGRPHANSIRNYHAKFPDGTEIELLTADEERDPLSATYVKHIAEGDGPAFVALYAPDTDALAARLTCSDLAFRRNGPFVTFEDDTGLRIMFFGPRNNSPTDRPEHFAHANGGAALTGVWIASDEDMDPLRALFATLRATFRSREIHAPWDTQAIVAELAEGEIVFLPRSRQVMKGRAIVGATVRVTSIEQARRALAAGGLVGLPVVSTPGGESVFVPPSATHGIWIEFREP